MDQKELRTLQILEEIQKNQLPSQRDLAKELKISLGLVNSFLKKLAHKGYLKIKAVPANRIKYILTPHGIAEKARLTLEYTKFSVGFYKQSRLKSSALLQQFEKEGVSRIVLYGANELSEIFYISMRESAVKLEAIVDDKTCGNDFLGNKILDPDELLSLSYAKIVITAIASQEIIRKKLIANGIKKEKVVMIE
jgi:DNA-binding MarR family transcriptional regulator